MHNRWLYSNIINNNLKRNVKYKHSNSKRGEEEAPPKKPSTQLGPHIFGQIPTELFHKIFMQLIPEEIGNKLFGLSKAMDMKARNSLFWREKFEIHFPHVLIKIKNENPKINLNEIDWYNEFIFTYKSQYYYRNPQTRRNFSYIKEGHTHILFDEEGVLTGDLYVFDRDGKTILEWMQQINRPEQLAVLYKHRENDLKDGALEYATGRSLFYWALNCQKSKADIEALIAEGFSIDSNCDADLTPIHIAASLGRLDLMTLFLSKNNMLLNAVDNIGFTPLMHASLNGHVDVVAALLKMNDIYIHLYANGRYSENCTGKNALHLAAQNGHAHVIDLLLKAGANAVLPDLYNVTKRLPIHLAACARSESAARSVKLLCEKNPGLVDFPDKLNQSPLLWAASQGNYKVVKYLSARNDVNLNAATRHLDSDLDDNSDKTPLHWAAQGGYSEIVKLLLKRGADATLKAGKMSFLPIHLAIKNYSKDISILKQTAYLDTVKAFIEHAPHLINAQNIEGSTPLILAVLEKNKRLVEYLVSKRGLIDLDVEICIPDNIMLNGKTALSLAAMLNESGLVQVLLREGAQYGPEKPIIKSELTEEVQKVFERHENSIKRKAIQLANSPFSFFHSSFGEKDQNIQQTLSENKDASLKKRFG
jgi:ankyrin repeat protein